MRRKRGKPGSIGVQGRNNQMSPFAMRDESIEMKGGERRGR